MFSSFEDDGPMWSGEGARVVRRRVIFDEPFLSLPVVQVSVGMWDIDGAANQRADISADKVTMEGFDMVFRTWGDTRIARIRGEWLAIGEIGHEDDFRL